MKVDLIKKQYIYIIEDTNLQIYHYLMRFKMSGKDIGNIIEITKNDAKAAFSDPVVIFILIAIIILPSLYALVNIDACWDPYEETGQLGFAIANMDKGTSYENQTINIGNELVGDLKNNDKFDWKFMSEDELREGVHDGKYYAGIIIPKNFTENVVSITTDNPKEAKLEFLVNVKANPVASKITTTGANAVYTALNSKIVQFIDLAAFDKLGELQSGLASGSSQLASGGSQLAAGAGQVSAGESKLTSSASLIKSGEKKITNGTKAIDSGSKQVEKGSEELQNTVDPSLLPNGPIRDYGEANVELAEGSSKLATGANELAKGSSKLANGSVELVDGSLALAAGSTLLSNSAAQALFAASSALGSSADALSAVTGINETMLGDYLYSPVKFDKQEVFSVPNFGSMASPFYLVLSMWVGALITCTLLNPGNSEKTKYSPFEMYFGKLLLFLVLSLLQASVTILGAFGLGIYIVNPLLFIISAMIVSGVFMVLIYSFTSALGDVGKGIAIILLVFQISGTNGMYPVEIMKPIFGILHPFMPMTYGISLVREAQLGLVWSNYWPSLVTLLAIGIITVIVMLIVKIKADKPAHYIEKRLEDSGLF